MHPKLIAVCGIVALVLSWTLDAYAAGYPTEIQFRQALKDIDALINAEGIQLKVLDGQNEGLDNPLLAAGLNIGANTCVVFFNTRPEDGLTQFFDGLSEVDLPQILRALSVHEVTHCVEQREAYVHKRFDKVLPDDYQQNDMTIEGYVPVVKSGAVETWGEALADITSLLYLKQIAPGQWLSLTLFERIKARGLVGMTILADPKGQALKAFGYFRSHFDKARDAAKVEADALGMPFIRFQLRDLRAKTASDLESMSHARKLLGHTTENMTREYIRTRVGERVSPVMAKSFSPLFEK